MALVLNDRVLEVSVSTGTGSMQLGGAPLGFQSFSDGIGTGNTTYYTITDDTEGTWEVGIGTYNAGYLTRDTIFQSSNGDAKVNFGTGDKRVWSDYPAARAAYLGQTITTLNGYVKGSGNALSSVTTIPNTDITGLGTMSTQNANAVAITGGAVNGTTIGATTPSTGAFTYASTNSTTSTTPALGYNASNSSFVNGATVLGSYLQNVMQNKSGTAGASTNFAVSNDLGTDSTYYGEFGMNSSVYSSGTPADFFSLNNGIYYSGHDGDISVGSGNGKNLYLAWGTTGDKAHVINATGSIGLNTNITGTTNFGTSGQVLTSGGSTATPTWTTPATGSVTSVATAGTVNGITLTGGPITTTGTVTLGGTLDLSSPPAIGGTTPAAGTFTTITGQTEVLKGTGTNLALQSQSFSTSPWTVFGTVTITPNSTTAPDGSSTASTLAITAGGGLYQGITAISLNTYTFSIYLKAASATTSRIVINTNLADPVLQTISVTTSWQRFTVSKTTSSGTNLINIQIDGGAGANTVYAWGAQLEIGSVTNTYIPTTSAAVYGTPTLSFSGVAGLGLQSDGSLYVSPAGTGALQAQATTSSTVGGNARGANAVDWQTSRDTATQVASGLATVVGGGSKNIASSLYSGVASGLSNTSSNLVTVVAGGQGNTANGGYSGIVGGISNNSAGYLSFIGGGQANTTPGYYNFVGGGFTNSGTANAAVTTQSGTMNATTAVTLSGSNASIKVGQYITGTSIAGDTYVAAISGTALTLSKVASGSSTSTLSFYTPHGVVVGGGNNQATGSYSFIGGGGDAGTAANRNVASGDWSFVGGGTTNVASGTQSVIVGGLQNIASGTTAVVGGGVGNNASGLGALISGGYNNISNNTIATVVGGRYGTTRGIVGNTIFAACNVPLASSSGVSQAALLILARQTTDATATVLLSEGTVANVTNQVILPNNAAYYFKGWAVSNVTGGGDTKGWEISGVIKRGSGVGTTALVGTPTVVSSFADVGAATWALTATADTTNGGLAITFTGQAATTIRTVCKIETTEVTY